MGGVDIGTEWNLKGNICIEWQTINDTGKALIDTWFLGILGIAEEYPVIELETDNE